MHCSIVTSQWLVSNLHKDVSFTTEKMFVFTKYLKYSCGVKCFIHEQDEMVQNLTKTEGWAQKIFLIYCQIMLKVFDKSSYKFYLFCMDESKLSQVLILCTKAPFLPTIQIEVIFHEILQTV